MKVKERIGFSFKKLSAEQQKGLLLGEIKESINVGKQGGIKPGAPFTHLLCYVYKSEVIEAVISELSKKLGQKGKFFPGQEPNNVAWIDFGGTTLPARPRSK